jgi:hypothetical protein
LVNKFWSAAVGQEGALESVDGVYCLNLVECVQAMPCALAIVAELRKST